MLMAYAINMWLDALTLILHLIADMDPQVVALDAPIEIRQAAAVNFKNHVKFNWVRISLRPTSSQSCHTRQ